MENLTSYSRLKVKRDTFYLPDPQGGVYFRNNMSSFRMEGGTIYQWIEKLMPMFNGELTLGELTEGLTLPYQNRIYEIGEALYKNGYVRDISKDKPHQLNRFVLGKYASQIEFIENFKDSGAHRFQEYRQAKVLAVGSGPFLVSLASALLESGLPKFHFIETDLETANQVRIQELVHNARKDDTEVMVEQIPFKRGEGKNFWQKAVQPYDWILFASQDVDELRNLNKVCKKQKKVFMPAICLEQVGLAGPLVHHESEGCWESAWRRVHQSTLRPDGQLQTFSPTAASILTNVTVFEFFKKATGIAGSNQSNQIYLLNLETLEGDWISFLPHPLAANFSFSPRLVENLEERIEQERNKEEQPSRLLEHFSLLTSEEIGIFHLWEERNLKQLPLPICYVQAVNPLSEGPSELLPKVVCSGFTHEEAKREAGLAGIELYVSQMINEFQSQKGKSAAGAMGIGAGETIEEAVCRGLQAKLEEELKNSARDQLYTSFRVQLGKIEDQRCSYYLNALTTLNGAPVIGFEKDVMGFPVIWVCTDGRGYSSSGLNPTLALRGALQKALLNEQDPNSIDWRAESTVYLNEKDFKLNIPSLDELTQIQLLQTSIKNLKRKNKRLMVYDLSFEPFLKHELAGVFGVQLREEES